MGLFVSHARHPLHSYYVIRNSEHLSGFTEHEVEVIAQLARYHRKSAPKAKLEPFAALSPEDQDAVLKLAGVVKALTAARTAKDRLKVPGLDPARADIVLGGAVLLEQVFAELGVETMVVSDFALREGVILDALQRARAASLHHLADLRYQSVRHLADLVPDERQHAEHSARLALQLYDASTDLQPIDQAYPQ